MMTRALCAQGSAGVAPEWCVQSPPAGSRSELKTSSSHRFLTRTLVMGTRPQRRLRDRRREAPRAGLTACATVLCNATAARQPAARKAGALRSAARTDESLLHAWVRRHGRYAQRRARPQEQNDFARGIAREGHTPRPPSTRRIWIAAAPRVPAASGPIHGRGNSRRTDRNRPATAGAHALISFQPRPAVVDADLDLVHFFDEA